MCILAEGPYVYSGRRPLTLCRPDLKQAQHAIGVQGPKAPQTPSYPKRMNSHLMTTPVLWPCQCQLSNNPGQSKLKTKCLPRGKVYTPPRLTSDEQEKESSVCHVREQNTSLYWTDAQKYMMHSDFH